MESRRTPAGVGEFILQGPVASWRVIILVLVLVVGGCVLEELQWQQMMHPNWPKQETAGAEVDRAVGAAVDRYEAVLDAQWGDADCVVERCPKSSKSLPGMPQGSPGMTGVKSGPLVVYELSDKPAKVFAME